MATIEVLNLTAWPVSLNQAGSICATLPVGFSGSIPLNGIYEVTFGSASVITTNITPLGLFPAVEWPGAIGFYSAVTVVNSTSRKLEFIGPGTAIAGQYPIGYDFHVYEVIDSSIHGQPSNRIALISNTSGGNATGGNYPIPNFQYSQLTFSETNGGFYWHWAQLAGSSTNYTTNGTGVSLGFFTASTTLKSVVVCPDQLHLLGYEREIEAVGIGFGLAATVLVFSFIMRLFRAIPSQGGDF